MRRAHGLIDLVLDLVEKTTTLVERTHDSVVARSARRLAPIDPAKAAANVVTNIQTAVSGGVFESIRVINGIARSTVNAVADVAEAGLHRDPGPDDLELTPPVRSTAAGTASWYVDHLQSSLNGFWGDYLNRRRNSLDLGMTLRHLGRHLPVTPDALAAAFPDPTNRVCIFVHGLATTERLWSVSSEEHYGDPDVTFGSQLRDDLGFTAIYLRYNTGRHISENGRALAKLLTEVLDAYPMPVNEIAIVGHSMGGLVARSAAHYASVQGDRWVARLRHVVCIGSPHLGAPLEKAVNMLAAVLNSVEAAGAQVPAELLDSRSAGIKDLRHGYTVDEEWTGKDPDEVFAYERCNVPLVDGVGYYFLAATISRDPDHPLGQLLGDLLVRPPSAFGEAPDPAGRVRCSSTAMFSGMNHFSMANHPDVYQALRDLLAA